MSPSPRFLSPAETAVRLGVTVRALRLYERRGLVAPVRTSAGWRAYGPEQLARLHQVLALKRLGLSLARVGELLAGSLAGLDAVLAVQAQVLIARRAETDRALAALAAARARLARGETLSLDDLTDLTQETTMTDKMTDDEWRETFQPLWDKHFTREEQERLALAKTGGAQAIWSQPEITAAWTRVIEDAEVLRSKGDPGSPEAFELVARWKVLQDLFTTDATLNAKTAAMWQEAFADPNVAPKLPMSGEVWAFVAEAARLKRAAAA